MVVLQDLVIVEVKVRAVELKAKESDICSGQERVELSFVPLAVLQPLHDFWGVEQHHEKCVGHKKDSANFVYAHKSPLFKSKPNPKWNLPMFRFTDVAINSAKW